MQAQTAFLYYCGEGVDPDPDMARQLYEKAAAQGIEEATAKLDSLAG